jgi:hypothetical protein
MLASCFIHNPPPHRIGILMSAAGRFLKCIDCHRSVEFPAGEHYDTIAKQFESHSCGVVPSSNHDAPLEGTSSL